MAVLQIEAQIIKRKKIIRNAAIIFITVIVLLTFFSKTINDFLLPEVELGGASMGSLTNVTTSQGEVFPLDPETIYSYGAWKISDVKASEGQTVSKGDVLAVIDAGDIKLEIKRMELNLLKLQNDLKLYKNGLQSTNLDLIKEDVEVALNAYNKAEKKLKDQKALYAYDAVALESVNEAEEQLDVAKRDYENKQKLLSQKEEEIKKSGDNYKITLEGKEAELEVCRLELADKKKNTPQDGIIKSPVDGIVRSVSVEKGVTTYSGQQLFEIVKNESGFFVKFALSSKASSQVDKKAAVTFTIKEPNVLEFKGIVTDKKYLANEGTYEYIAKIEKLKDTIEIGQKVDVLIQKSSEPCIIVPNSSVFIESGKACIYVLKTKEGIMGEENYAEKVAVTVTETDDFSSAISGNIGDEKIVVFSSKPLYDKIQVKLR